MNNVTLTVTVPADVANNIINLIGGTTPATVKTKAPVVAPKKKAKSIVVDEEEETTVDEENEEPNFSADEEETVDEEEEETTVDEEEETVDEEEDKVVVAPKKKVAAAVAAPTSGHTRESVLKAFQTTHVHLEKKLKSKEKAQGKLNGILKKYGAKNTRTLDPKKFGAVVKELKALRV